jgi:hypothetical protein
MTREEVIKLIKNSDLSESARQSWVSRIIEEGLTQEILDDLKAAFQIEIDKGFEELEIDFKNTPEYKQHEAEMLAEIEDAQAEYNKTMDDLDKEEKKLENDTAKALDDLKAQAIKDQIQ